MEGSQNSSNGVKSKEERDLEAKNNTDRNHFIIQSYVHYYNYYLAVRNPKHTIKDVWNMTQEALKKRGHDISRADMQQVVRNVKHRAIFKVSRSLRHKTGGGQLPALTPTEQYYITCHAGKELTHGIEGALELGLDKFKEIYASEIEKEIAKQNADEKESNKKKKVCSTGFKSPQPCNKRIASTPVEGQNKNKIANVGQESAGGARTKYNKEINNQLPGVLTRPAMSRPIPEIPTALKESSATHLQAIHNSTPIKSNNVAEIIYNRKVTPATGQNFSPIATSTQVEDGSASPVLCNYYDSQMELSQASRAACRPGEKRLVLSTADQQIVMEPNDSMTSSQFLSGVQELHGKEISFQTAHQGQEQLQVSDRCNSNSLFSHSSSMTSLLNTPHDYIDSSFGSGMTNAQPNNRQSTSLPRTDQVIGEGAGIPTQMPSAPVSAAVAAGLSVLNDDDDPDRTIDPNEEMNELAQMNTDQPFANSTIDQSQLTDLTRIGDVVTQRENAVNVPGPDTTQQVDSSQLPQGESSKDYDWVSLDPDEIPEEVLTAVKVRMSTFLQAQKDALLEAAKMEGVIQRQRFIKSAFTNVVRPNIAAILIHQLFRLNSDDVLAKALHSIPKDEGLTIAQKKIYYIYMCQKIAEDMRDMEGFMDIFRRNNGPLFKEFLSSKRKRQPNEDGIDRRQNRSKREIGLSNIMSDDFFDPDKIMSEPEDEDDGHENGDEESEGPAIRGDGRDHLRFFMHPSFEEPIKGRVWTESFLKRSQVSYLTADRYRVDAHVSALKEVRRNSVAREMREKAREDREQLEDDRRKKQHDFAVNRENREAEAHNFLKNRDNREQAEHDAKLLLLKAERDYYLLLAKKLQRDLGE